MKQVLLIDAPLLFREFLKEKLSIEKVVVEVAQGRRDAFTKMVSLLPSLIILDISTPLREVFDFLEKKRADPNASLIPVVVTGPIIPREAVARLAQYNVIKYFNKPINFDVFFESVGRMLKIAISIGNTPCILETHLNDNIIFIEIAQGLNREKLALLKYKLSEIIDQNHLSVPKIVLMMTDFSLSFVDGSNLELLFDNIIADPRIQKRNVKVLTLDTFTRDLIEGHTQYNGIECSTNLSTVLNALVDNTDQSSVTDLISDRILTQTNDTEEGTVQMRFYSETGLLEQSENAKTNNSPQIAVVDDDLVTKALLQRAFVTTGSQLEFFDSGAEFIAATNKKIYDLVILDLYMSGLSGFDILISMHNKKYPSPIIIYSNPTSRESVMQALKLGARSYLIKPLRPELILQKALEVMKTKR